MLTVKSICCITDMHPSDEWYNYRSSIIGRTLKVIHSHESVVKDGFQFVVGELEDELFGDRIKTFLAVKLQEIEGGGEKEDDR